MGTWYCDNEVCNQPFIATKEYQCGDKACECADPHHGRVFCSKKCHDEVLKCKK